MRPVRIARPLRSPGITDRAGDLQRLLDLAVVAPHLAPIERPIGPVAELAARLEPFGAEAQRDHGEVHRAAADRSCRCYCRRAPPGCRHRRCVRRSSRACCCCASSEANSSSGRHQGPASKPTTENPARPAGRRACRRRRRCRRWRNRPPRRRRIRASAPSRRRGTLGRAAVLAARRALRVSATSAILLAACVSRRRLGFCGFPRVAPVQAHAHIAARARRAAEADLAPRGRMRCSRRRRCPAAAAGEEESARHAVPGALRACRVLHRRAAGHPARARRATEAASVPRLRLGIERRESAPPGLAQRRQPGVAIPSPLSPSSLHRPARPPAPAAGPPAAARCGRRPRQRRPFVLVKKRGSRGSARRASIDAARLLVPGRRVPLREHVVAGITAQLIGMILAAARAPPARRRQRGEARRRRQRRAVQDVLAPVAPAAHVARDAEDVEAVADEAEHGGEPQPPARARHRRAAGRERRVAEQRRATGGTVTGRYHRRVVIGAAEMQQCRLRRGAEHPERQPAARSRGRPANRAAGAAGSLSRSRSAMKPSRPESISAAGAPSGAA